MKKKLTLFILGAVASLQSQTNGLVACYALNGHALEAVSNLSGTVSSAVTATVDRNNSTGGACSFSAASNGITLPGDPALKADQLTFSAWIKPVNVGTSQFIVFTKNTASSNFEAYFLVYNGLGQFVAGKGNNGTVVNATSTNTFVGSTTWYHVAFAFDNTGIWLYVNGNLEASVTSSLAVGYAPGKNVILGGSNEGFNLPFTGCMDNARFYNRVLSSTEITQLYNSDPACAVPLTTGMADGVNDIDASLYPNPACGEFHIRAVSPGRVVLTDALGHQVLDREFGAGEEAISLQDLERGMYYARISSGSASRVVKLLKQ